MVCVTVDDKLRPPVNKTLFVHRVWIKALGSCASKFLTEPGCDVTKTGHRQLARDSKTKLDG